MKHTKEEVLAEAKKLGLTLSDAEVDQLVKDEKLPEKKQTPEERREEMKARFTFDQLLEKYLDAASESKDRKLKIRDLEGVVEDLTGKLNANGDFKTKFPELEKQLVALKESEKKRRELKFNKFDDGKKKTLDYLLNVDIITADKFDETVELFLPAGSAGASGAPQPGSPPPAATLEAQLAIAQKEGRTLDVVSLKRQIAEAAKT